MNITQTITYWWQYIVSDPLIATIYGLAALILVCLWAIVYSDKIEALVSWIQLGKRRRKQMKNATKNARDHLMATTIKQP